MGTFIGITYFVGIFVAIIVHRVRAGIPIMARISFFHNFGWTMVHVFKSMFWPVVFGIWLATGRPGPKVVFTRT